MIMSRLDFGALISSSGKQMRWKSGKAKYPAKQARVSSPVEVVAAVPVALLRWNSRCYAQHLHITLWLKSDCSRSTVLIAQLALTWSN
jgi:hypothetical protein